MMPLGAHGGRKYGATTLRLKSSQLQNVTVEERRLDPGLHQPGICQTNELAFVLAGTTVTIQNANGVVYRRYIQPGASCICPVGTYEKESGTTSAIDCLHLFLHPEAIQRSAVIDFGVDPSKVELRYTGGIVDPALYQIAMTLRLALKPGASRHRLFYDGMQAVLTAYLIEHYSIDRWRHRPVDNFVERAILDRVSDYIEDHLAEDISLRDLATEAGLGELHFYRIFEKSVGIPPHRYVSFRRVQEAQRLIELGRLSYEEIALATGFRDVAELDTIFRALTGVSCAQYRATRRS